MDVAAVFTFRTISPGKEPANLGLVGAFVWEFEDIHVDCLPIPDIELHKSLAIFHWLALKGEAQVAGSLCASMPSLSC